MVRETRHLWVGNLPEHVREEKIVEHFKRYGRVESVKVLRKRGSEGGVAAFVDFVDIKSAQKAHNAVNKMGDRDLRTDYNEPGSVPSAVRGLDDSSPSSSRDVTGFSRGTVGPVFAPPVSLHTREGRYERRIDGSSESRERAYDHTPYGHHERSGTFERQRHYNADYYRERSLFAAAGAGSSGISGSFEATDPHFDSRIRDPFSLASTTRRDFYRDDRGRRVDRTYHHRRSRSSHSSQSRHPSPQRTTGQTSKTAHSPKRGPLSPGTGPGSQSRSRSSSSDSVSSTSSTGSGSDSNSSSSDGSRPRSVQSSATHAPTQSSMVLDSEEPRRSFGIKVQNLPARSTDTSLKDGLFHEFKKHGKVTSVQIHGASEDRYGLVFFRQQEDQEKALSVPKGKLFFGMLIEVTAWNGPETESENEFRPLDGRIDEFHPKATRTLFIGNLEKTTSREQLFEIFQRFGEIVDIDIKKINGVPQYAFVQYSDIASVCKAIKKMDGEYLGSNRLKLGFGKSMPTACVWLDGLTTNITEQYLTRHFCCYGHVVKVLFDRMKGMALIFYNNTDFAQTAVRETKGWKIGGSKIKVDFASQESQMAFFRAMQTSGQDIRELYEIPPERREERRPLYHEFTAERAYYETIRTPALYTDEARREYAARGRERFPELEQFQGEHYDPRYHEDPRDYRDYRDPFEQDIRKYTYIQRERERFEADRSRWSPSHHRRPITPAVSPSPTERTPRESERRVYSQSSERSGSVSSVSPTHFEKSEKTLPEHGSKSDKGAPPDRAPGSEKTKRTRRKEKGDKAERVKSRKSPSNPLPDTDHGSALVDVGTGKGKGTDQEPQERQKCKGDNDCGAENPFSASHHDSLKSEKSETAKVDHSEIDGKNRVRKHPKPDAGNDGKDPSADSDRVVARKRHAADSSGRNVHQKRSRLEEEDCRSQDPVASSQTGKESDCDKHKDSQRRDSRIKSGAPQDVQEDAKILRVKLEGPAEASESKRLSGQASRRFSQEGNADQSSLREQEPPSGVYKMSGQGSETAKSSKVKEEHVDIDLSQSYRKQMEQNRRLQQRRESDKPGKPDKSGSPQESEGEDMEHRSLVHEVGKPPEDVTDNFPSHRQKKQDQFESDGIKRERVYRSFRQKSEDSEWNNTSSPGHQFSHHTEEESDHAQKTLVRIDKMNADLELLVKRNHNTQGNKSNTLHPDEDQQKRWENRVKRNTLPDLNFSRNRNKTVHNSKRLEYGAGPDIEPGEVRSDSEEDRETKARSPVASTSKSFSERAKTVERFSDPKIAHLERNKFYSFALDQTITPDTKALLERAKSLSSSREDNWSFLDYDSHFASLRNRKDTEKIESTPRPMPSWYMKKKKIRSGSEDKLDDRKEEPKPEEHERRELFASRFLHSPVFELDSRRLQHLERKYEEAEHSQKQLSNQQAAADGEHDSGPVVLFHSRFLELMRLQQQKNKSQAPEVTDEMKAAKASTEEPERSPSPETKEPIAEPEIKPISPAEELVPEPTVTPPISQRVQKDLASPEQTIQFPVELAAAVPLVGFAKPENETHQLQPVHYPPVEIIPDSQDTSVKQEAHFLKDTYLSHSEMKVDATEDDTSCAGEKMNLDLHEFVSSSEPDLDSEPVQPEVVPPALSSSLPSHDECTDLAKKDTYCSVSEPEEENTPKVCKDTGDDTKTEGNALIKDYKMKEMKPKKFKPSPPEVSTPILSVPEKRATRKSERIDKEKLKRGSSPRADTTKSTAKSPLHGSDVDTSETSISSGRTRRRNVKSVYATPVDDEAPVRTHESPRSARKRGTDKDPTQQQNNEPDLPTPPPAARGRPPKNRRHCEDSSAVKMDKTRMENKDAEPNESDGCEKIHRSFKGKSSLAVTKAPSNLTSTAQMFGSVRKGEKFELTESNDQEMECSDDNSLTLVDSSKEPPSPQVDQKREEKEKPKREMVKDEPLNEKISEGKPNGKDEYPPLVSEEKNTNEKDKLVKGKGKVPRTPKSPVLKNLKIRLDVKEVKDHVSKCSSKEANVEDSDLSSLDKKELLDPSKNLSSHEMELEQAVENIAKLTDPPFPREPQTPSGNIADLKSFSADLKSFSDEEKPNPASETELIAAIDSITAEDGAVVLPQAAPLRVDIPAEAELQDSVQHAKEEELEINPVNLQDEPLLPTTPKKGGKRKPKTIKGPKGQKHARKDSKEDPPSSEETSSHLAVENATPSANIVPELIAPAATATVITPTTAWKSEQEPLALKTPDVKVEPQSPGEEQVQHIKTVFPQSKSPVGQKPQSPSLSPLSCKSNMKSIQNSRAPASPPDWLRHPAADTAVPTLPALPLAPKEKQPSADSETVEVARGPSDLRQILLKHKTVSLPGTTYVSTNLPTAVQDQNLSEHNTMLTVAPTKSALPDGRISSPSVRTPATLTPPETKSVISVIASTGLHSSVISRLCNPPEHEEKANPSMANQGVEVTLPKPNYRPSKDDTGSYLVSSVADEVTSVSSRFGVESSALAAGSCPGLRVNTSEGVVVLSHSGQKTEGPQRISAKISQIPPATAGDMESQQLVSMPQMKPELYGHSQSGLPKGSLQADHGHPGKAQSSFSSNKQESALDKMESGYHTGSQGVVKRLGQGVANQGITSMYHQEYLPTKHQKKIDSGDCHAADGPKAAWASAISPAISPHLPSPPGNHVGFVTAAGDRNPSHLGGAKQEARSPRKSGHPHSPFTKVSSPIGSSSPKGIAVMLPTGLSAMQPFIPGVHHPEQSVIMPPHSVSGGLGRMSPHPATQSIPVGHLVQGDVRVNTPPLSVMSYGIHGESLTSPWSGSMQQRPTSPQTIGRDKVLKVNPGALRGHDVDQEEPRRFHQQGRQAATQIKAEMIQSDPRVGFRGAVPMEAYMTQREMRALLHQQGERSSTDPHSGHLQETAASNLPMSMSPMAHILPKGVSEKDMAKPMEGKRPHSPLSKDGLMGIRQAGATVSSPQRVALMPPGLSGTFPEYSQMYSNPRGIHSQMPDAATHGVSDGKIPQSVNMMQLLTKYPIVWQGLLALKNDTAAVQLHFVCGNKALAHRSLPLQEGGAFLRIVQRMRLEASQLESVARRMTGECDFCLLLALPCGRDQDDVLNQTQALKAAFINYLQAKLAAGIINIPNPGSNQPAYVLQIFPPCEFSESHLSQLAPDLLNRISSISPHLMIVITSV
ncbi:msx2-interacting protein [Stigmatopora argus]